MLSDKDIIDEEVVDVEEPKDKKAKKPKKKKNASPHLFKGIIAAVVVLALVIIGFNSYYTLEEDEYAVIKTWGSVVVEETPGIKFKIPFIQEVNKVSKASKQFSVGYDIDTDESIHKESFMITSDYNFVNVDFYFEYQIVDPVKYFYASEEPEMIVKNLAQSYIRDTVGSRGVDEVLTTGKYEIQTEVKTKLQERLEYEDIVRRQE